MLRAICTGLWLLSSSFVEAADPVVYTLAPPKEVGDALARLRSGEGRAEMKKALAAIERAAPYLRAELASASPGSYKNDLAEILAAQSLPRFERNRARMKEQDWAAQGRFDLLASLLCSCPKDDWAVGIADQILRANRRVMGEFGRLAQLTGKHIPFADRGFGQLGSFTHVAGESVTLKQRPFGIALIRAEKCRIETHDRAGWLLAINRELDDPSQWPKQLTEYTGTVGVINGPAAFENALYCLFVVDGDVELRTPAGLARSLLICNGNVRASDKTRDPLTDAMICAAGDIDLPASKKPGRGAYFWAGGTVTFAEEVKGSGQMLERQKELPFGVKFIDPKDFGIDATPFFKAGILVRSAAKDSVFAGHDVRPGDLITQANGVRVNSLAAFRRELRRGVVEESITLHIFRDGETITRIVFLDGVPKS